MTWDVLAQRLTRAHPTQLHPDGHLVVTVSRESGDEPMTVRRLVVDHRPWIEISTPIGPRAAVQVGVALSLNFELPVGMLQVVGEELQLRQCLPLEGADVSVIVDTLEALAERAPQLRTIIATGGPTSEAFQDLY